MKTVFTEKDLAIKSVGVDDLVDMGIEYLGNIPGLRNELNKMIEHSKKEGPQKGQKSSFIAVYDKDRKEYILMIKDHYDPRYLVTMLYDLVTEPVDNEEEELAVRMEQINSYLNEISKNESIDLETEKIRMQELTRQYVKTFKLYDNDSFSQEELERIFLTMDSSFFEPMMKIIKIVLDKIKSGNLSIPVDTGDFPLPDEE